MGTVPPIFTNENEKLEFIIKNFPVLGLLELIQEAQAQENKAISYYGR